MRTFSKASLDRLNTCHIDLQTLFNEVIKDFDCTVIEGHRGKEAQDEAFRTGKSQLRYPNGNHNSLPSNAVDVAPYDTKNKRINWNDKITFYYFAGFVIGKSIALRESGKITHKIRWGGDWDSDNDLHNQTFFDLVHFEIVN